MYYSTNQKSVNEIISTLQKFEKKVQKKLLRQGLRKLGNQLALRIKSGITWNSKKVYRSVRVKIKSYKRGRIMWMGVGFINSATDDWKTKVKAHAYNRGWRPYPKGRPTNRKGKGWRKGVRRLGGAKIYDTKFVDKVYQQAPPLINQMLYDNITQAIKELSNV